MNNRQEIELAIRASIGSSRKTLADLSKGVDEVSRNIDRQSAAAARGESSLDELNSSMAALKATQDQLKGRDSLASEFLKQGEAIAKAQAKVEKTTKAYDDYKAKLDAAGKADDKQNALLAKKAATMAAAEAALKRQQGQQAALQQTLTDAGIATENLAADQDALRNAMAAVAVVMNKAQAAIQGYGTAVRAARDANKAAADAAAANAKKQADAAADAAAKQKKLFDQSERFAANIAAAQAEFAKENALIKQGQDAEAAARKYQTLARAATDLRPKIVSLQDALKSITDPDSARRSTVGGIEAEVNATAKAVGAIRGKVKDYERVLKSLSDVQKSLSGQAGLVDTFRKQVAAVRSARAEFVQARANVLTLAAAVKQGGDAGQQFVGQLAQAETRLKQTSGALRESIIAARGTQGALRDAGISTNDLAAAEKRLQDAAKGTVSNLQNLTAAVDKYGLAKSRANKGGTLFGGDDGRTTLSFLQRIRGELLALATTYTGLQGSINLAKGALDAFNTREGAKNQLGIALENDRARIDSEYAYVRAQSDRIGIEFEGALKQFAKFSTAAALAGRDRQEIKFIFETFAELGRVANLSTADLDGVFKALEQIFSKGKIQAEELRGQLGDRLFGAFQVAAASLKDTFPDLDKALKDGVVTSGQLVKIAEQYKKIIAGQLPAAQQSLAAEQMRLNNAFFDFKTIIADKGFADSFRKLVVELNAFLQSGEGAKLAENLANKFALIAKVLLGVVKNIDALVTAGTAFFAIWAVGRINGIAAALTALGGAAGLAGTKIASTAGAVGVLQAALAGFAVGTLLTELFPNLATNLQAGIQMIIAAVRTSFGTAFELIPPLAGKIFLKILDIAVFVGSKIVGVFSGLARKVGLGDLADSLTAGMEKAAKDIAAAQAGLSTGMANTLAAGRKELEAELARINDMAGGGVSTRNVGKSFAPATPKPAKVAEGKAALSDEEINKRKNAIEKMVEALNALDARIDKADKDLLAPQLAAVDKELLRIKNDIAGIAKFDKGRAAQFSTQLEGLAFGLRQQTLRKFNEGVLAEQESLNRDLEALDAAAGRKDKESLQARLDAIEQTYASTFRKIEEMRAKLLANAPRAADPADQAAVNAQAVEPADQMAERARLAVEELKRLEIKKINMEALRRQEETLNNLITERAARLKTIDEQEEASIITRQQAEDRRKAVLDEMQVKIVNLANGARLFTEAMAGQIDQSQLDEFLAKTGLAVASMDRLNNKFAITRNELDQMATTGLVGVLDDAIKGLTQAAAGTKSWSEAIKGVGRSFLAFSASFLREIALMIAKQLILKQIQTMFPGFGSAVGIGSSFGVLHAGGIAGSTATRRRSVDPGIFANAPRYHNGKLVGLANNEVPAILEKQEEVLSKNDPRNALNGGLAAGGGGGGSMRVVLVDDRANVAEAMSGTAGEQVVVQHLRKNVATIKSLLKS